MTKTQLLLAAAVLAFAPGPIFAQTDFFWSFQDLNQGATNTAAVAEMSPGESGSVFLYYSTNGPADSDIDTGALLDIATSQSGVLQFDVAEAFDFNISLFGSPLGVRWGDLAGETGTVSDDLIDEFGALTIFSGVGIQESNNGSAGLLDEGYDSGVDAFLFGRVDFTMINDPALAGSSVDINLSVGAGGVVNAGAFVDVSFGTATIMVAVAPVLGDLNGDGVVDMTDVNPFVQVLISGVYNPQADINGDGVVTLLDVRPFVDLL